MQKFKVGGMSCAACSARVEKAVSKVGGVTSVAVNLLTGDMQVEGSAPDSTIISAVVDAGYTAKALGAAKIEEKDELVDTETPKRRKRLISSAIILVILMYITMGALMWDFPLPHALAENPMAIALIELLLTTAIVVINQNYFINGFKSAIRLSPNMDTLVALGSAAAYIYSTVLLFEMTTSEHAAHLLHGLYYESSAMILTLITVGKTLEAHAKGKTTDALRSLMNLAPKEACVIRDGKEVVIAASELAIGDIFVIRAGDSIPADGVVVEGGGAVDESALTGESIPIDKAVGDKLSAATVSRSGYMHARTTAVGADTTLSAIIRMVSDAAATKAPIAKVADRVSAIFVPTVLAIAAVTTGTWLALGAEIGRALSHGISVLVISCPCALGLATPVAIMVASGKGARNGILFKSASSIEAAGRITAVALDKTGTLTEGRPTVCDVIERSDRLLEVAFALEVKSEHPLGRAIAAYAEERLGSPLLTENFQTFAGGGLTAALSGKNVFGGSVKFALERLALDAEKEDVCRIADKMSEEGKTPTVFGQDGRLLGVIALSDKLRAESAQMVAQMRNMGLRVVMLTGDRRATAEAVGRMAGVDEVMAELLPGDKSGAVQTLANKGERVAMVGDGINDAPALASADLGIAVGAGTDVAIDSANVVLMGDGLSELPAALRLGRAALTNIHENLFWAFIYNAIGIPLAAGLMGLDLDPMFAAAAMSLSSFCVVSNALRLNIINIKKEGKFAIKKKHKGVKKMEKTTKTITIKIEGMMCSHCEARVKSAIEGVPHVTSADVSHERGDAVITHDGKLSEKAVIKAIEKAGYKTIC